MTDFIRARSSEQKAQRMQEVKDVTASLFEKLPYHEITLSTIGENLGWSRANLYKYVSSKEEVFLSLADDARHAYYNDLMQAFSHSEDLDHRQIAQRWATIYDNNKDWATLGSILVSIIEQNVSYERLKEFKKNYYDEVFSLTKNIAANIGVPKDDFTSFFNTIHYHASGICGVCATNPQVKKIKTELGIPKEEANFKNEMEKFILMCLDAYCED